MAAKQAFHTEEPTIFSFINIYFALAYHNLVKVSIENDALTILKIEKLKSGIKDVENIYYVS